MNSRSLRWVVGRGKSQTTWTLSFLQWAYSRSTDVVSEELQLWHTKETLGHVDEKSMHALQDVRTPAGGAEGAVLGRS